jgi:hypothetical protein
MCRGGGCGTTSRRALRRLGPEGTAVKDGRVAGLGPEQVHVALVPDVDVEGPARPHGSGEPGRHAVEPGRVGVAQLGTAAPPPMITLFLLEDGESTPSTCPREGVLAVAAPVGAWLTQFLPGMVAADRDMRERSAAMRGSCCMVDPPAPQTELGDLRAQSQLRTPRHCAADSPVRAVRVAGSRPSC